MVLVVVIVGSVVGAGVIVFALNVLPLPVRLAIAGMDLILSALVFVALRQKKG